MCLNTIVSSLFCATAQPGPPLYMAVIPGPTSVHFSLKILPVNGGTPLTSFVLQWRKIGTEKWMEKTVAVSGVSHIEPLNGHLSSFLSKSKAWCRILCVLILAFAEGAVITGLKPYTQYSVRLAALNSVGVGEFSDIKSVRTLGIRKYCTSTGTSIECRIRLFDFSVVTLKTSL